MRQLKISKSITNRDTASLDRFLADIGKEQMISADEEVELARRIKQGDQEALERLTKANLRFVVSVAKQYQNQGISLPDLINEGNIGLIKAAKRFDETRGFKFISYAVWWIRQAICQAIADQSRIVRLPLNQVGTINKIKKEIAHLEQEFQRAPTLDEISEAMDLPVDKVNEILRINNHPQSMDSPVSPDDDTKFSDTFIYNVEKDTDDKLINESLSSEINEILKKTLNEKEIEIVKLFFGIGVSHEYTLDEIGDAVGLSRERVRQIKERALKRLKQESKNRNLKIYLLGASRRNRPPALRGDADRRNQAACRHQFLWAISKISWCKVKSSFSLIWTLFPSVIQSLNLVLYMPHTVPLMKMNRAIPKSSLISLMRKRENYMTP